jgi:hypothetical protein
VLYVGSVHCSSDEGQGSKLVFDGEGNILAQFLTTAQFAVLLSRAACCYACCAVSCFVTSAR